MVPEKSVFFWSTTLTASRRCSMVYSLTGRPPTSTVPSAASYSRGIRETSVVLPLPVPPRMPTVAPEGMCSSTSRSVHSGLCGSYLKETWEKSMLPFSTCAPSTAAWSVMAGTSSSTSTIRLAQATDRVIIIKIMDTIIREMRICVI